MIDVNIITGGPKRRAITVRLMRVIQELDPVPEPYELQTVPTIVVEFHVPGEIVKPDYSGMRTGSFFKRDSAQVVQVSIPDEIADSVSPDEFIFSAIRAALELGRRRMATKGIEYPILAALEYVDRVERKMHDSR